MCKKLAAVLEPILTKLEDVFGRGGIMPTKKIVKTRKFDFEDDDDEIEGPKDIFQPQSA